MLPKDLLVMVFDQIENGHDMIKFGELNRKCHQIWKQKITVEGKNNDKAMYLRNQSEKIQHGIRHFGVVRTDYLWNVTSEINWYYNQKHGAHLYWDLDGNPSITQHYCHNQLHGLQFSWPDSKYLDYTADNEYVLHTREKLEIQVYHHGKKISGPYYQVYTNWDGSFKSAHDTYHDVWYHRKDVRR